jgi:hypothetical protein
VSSQYLPIAAASGANVDTQADFAGSGYQTLGFTSGIVRSAEVNKCLRQSSMMSAALAQFVCNQLGVNLNDDGNLENLIENVTAAVQQSGEYLLLNDRSPVEVFGDTSSYQNLTGLAFTPQGILNTTGRVVRITGFGLFTTSGSAEQVNLAAAIGGVNINLGTPNVSGTPTTVRFKTEIILQTIVPGTSGSLFCSSSALFSCNGGAVSETTQAGWQELTGIDLTSPLGCQWMIAFGSASASNVATQYNGIMEVLQ